MDPVVLATAALAACSAVLHLLVVVPRLPPPRAAPHEEPPDYRARATGAAALAVAVGSLAATLLVGPKISPMHLAAWFGLLGAGTTLVWVDLRTTWLPRVLNHICLAQVVAGVGAMALFDAPVLLSAAAGGVAALILFHLVWRLGSGFGYGDVRLAGIVGTVAGTHGVQFWFTSILAATVVGALWAVGHALRSRGRDASPFPYGPALWAGPVLAAALTLP